MAGGRKRGRPSKYKKVEMPESWKKLVESECAEGEQIDNRQTSNQEIKDEEINDGKLPPPEHSDPTQVEEKVPTEKNADDLHAKANALPKVRKNKFWEIIELDSEDDKSKIDESASVEIDDESKPRLRPRRATRKEVDYKAEALFKVPEKPLPKKKKKVEKTSSSDANLSESEASSSGYDEDEKDVLNQNEEQPTKSTVKRRACEKIARPRSPRALSPASAKKVKNQNEPKPSTSKKIHAHLSDSSDEGDSQSKKAIESSPPEKKPKVLNIKIGSPDLNEAHKFKRNGLNFKWFKYRKPKKIIGLCEENDSFHFMVKWHGEYKATRVTREVANKRCPQLVIKFYQDRIKFVSLDEVKSHEIIKLN